MKNFVRTDLSFSLCGLNCDLCSMKISGNCPGCGGGEGNQGCSIARCNMGQGGHDYCFECNDFSCSRYDGITEFDSFITRRNQLSDIKKAQAIGIDAYHEELKKKADILEYLLGNFNDGRRKTFFCLAINLLELSVIEAVMGEIKKIPNGTPLKEKADIAVNCFEIAAKQKGIILKLNKKPPKSASVKSTS